MSLDSQSKAVLEEHLPQLLLRSLHRRVVDPLVDISILSTTWSIAQNIATGRLFDILNVKLCSNAPAVVLGTLSLLELGGTVGFNSIYWHGYLDCHLDSAHPALADTLSVTVDVVAQPDVPCVHHPRYVTIQRAIDDGLVAPGSPVATYAVKYGLQFVSLFGSSLIGPNTEMIAALEHLWPGLQPRSVLDLFAGTGALGTVCMKLGAERVVSADVKAPPGLPVLEDDVFTLPISGRFDLAIVDPFVEQVDLVAHILLPKLSTTCEHLLLNIGPAGGASMLDRLDALLATHFTRTTTFVINDTYVSLWRSLEATG